MTRDKNWGTLILGSEIKDRSFWPTVGLLKVTVELMVRLSSSSVCNGCIVKALDGRGNFFARIMSHVS